MRKWDKSYTYAIVTVAVFALLFAGARFLDHRSYPFEGRDAVAERLEEWTPDRAGRGEPRRIDGEVLYYSIDCFRHYGVFELYRGIENAERRFLNSDVKTADDVGVIAVLYYDRVHASTYQNGAVGYRVDCTVFLLDPGTLELLASGTVEGGPPPASTSGGDRWGKAPGLAECRNLAEALAAELRGTGLPGAGAAASGRARLTGAAS